MKYLAIAISSTVSKPRYLFLFVLFNLLMLPISFMKQMGIVQGAVAIALSIFFGLLSLYLISGVYAAAWKNLKGEGTNILEGAKKYFTGVLGVSIVIGIIGAISFIPFGMLHKFVFFQDLPAVLYGKRLDANIIRAIPAFLTTSLFVYALPGLFVENLPGNLALAKSWRFLFKNFVKSRTVVIVLLISTIIKIVLTQWAVIFDYSSNQYWQLITLSSIFTHVLTFLVFLTAAQILHEFSQKNTI